VVGQGPVVRSGETVAAHWLDEPRAEASASESLGDAPENLVFAYGMEDTIHA
jgi:hypothetical protein